MGPGGGEGRGEGVCLRKCVVRGTEPMAFTKHKGSKVVGEK